jgi:arylsulfatase A-like enzyme
VILQNKNISRRKLMKAATTATIAAKTAARSAPADAPNIVLILADDLGYGDLSSFGATDLRTPHIDGLINAGVRFRNFYANSPVCSPTRASILSGQYPDLVGVPGLVRTFPQDNWGYLSKDAVLLPEMLKAAGYHSAIVGKWNLGLESPNTPTERGFDFFHGFLGDMMEDYYTHLRHGRNYMRRNDQVIDPKGHATDLFTEWSIDYLKQRKQDGRKFFLYLAYNAPHVPIQPPAEWLNRVKEREPHLDEKRAKIVALIEHLDMSVGRVLAALKENGQAENTLVIFTSDNGGQASAGANNAPLRGAKEDMYEGGIRVPMGAAWPGRISPGSHSDGVALAMDLPPTICEAAGVSPPKNLNGISILSAMQGKGTPPADRELVWVRRDGGMRCQAQDYYAYRRGEWKILQNNPFEPLRLYNLREDPNESNDLSQREPKLYREMVARLMLHVQQAGRVPWQPPEGFPKRA